LRGNDKWGLKFKIFKGISSYPVECLVLRNLIILSISKAVALFELILRNVDLYLEGYTLSKDN
jgi:hypothetical protein